MFGIALRRTTARLQAAAKQSGKTRVIAAEHLGEFQVGRFDPEKGFRMETYHFEMTQPYMVMDLLLNIKVHFDPSIAFRNSCCEGICGSCAVNINGVNSLSCITPASLRTVVLPLPNMPILRDLVVDFRYFFKQYELIKPYSGGANRDRYHVQNVYERYLQKLTEQDKLKPRGPTLEDLLDIGKRPELLTEQQADAASFLEAVDSTAEAKADATVAQDILAAVARVRAVNAAPLGVLPTQRADLQDSYARTFGHHVAKQQAAAYDRLVV